MFKDFEMVTHSWKVVYILVTTENFNMEPILFQKQFSREKSSACIYANYAHFTIHILVIFVLVSWLFTILLHSMILCLKFV